MKNFTIGNAGKLLDAVPPASVIVGYQFDDGYWHTEVFLHFHDGATLKFASDEHCLAPLFDCSTLTVGTTLDVSPSITGVTRPHFVVDQSVVLRRAEWLVPAAHLEGATVGNNPHMQISGLPYNVPENATVSAVLVAGILLYSTDARRIAIIASESVPLNVELVSDAKKLDDLLERHEIIRDNAV